MPSKAKTNTSSSVSEARQLADLLGIGEGDPLAYSSDSEAQEDRLVDSTDFAEGLSESSRAQFCAQYLPALIRALGEITRSRRKEIASFCTTAIEVLRHLRYQPLFQTHFLRASPEAEDVLLTLVELFTHFPRNVPIQSKEGAEFYWTLVYIAGMIHLVLSRSLVHGSACKVNLVVPPALGSEVLSACQAHLSVVAALSSKAERESSIMLKHLGHLLTLLPAMLALEGVQHVVFSKRVKTNSTSTGTLRCALSTLDLEEWDGEEVDECGRLSENGRKLKFCSICKSVAYCSPEHQRADWKKHKKVCFAPSW